MDVILCVLLSFLLFLLHNLCIISESCVGKQSYQHTHMHMDVLVVWVTVAWRSVVAECWRRRLGAGGLS